MVLEKNGAERWDSSDLEFKMQGMNDHFRCSLLDGWSELQVKLRPIESYHLNSKNLSENYYALLFFLRVISKTSQSKLSIQRSISGTVKAIKSRRSKDFFLIKLFRQKWRWAPKAACIDFQTLDLSTNFYISQGAKQ